MSRINYLLSVFTASILLVSIASADVAQPTQQYSIHDLINDELLNQEIKVLVQVRKISGKDHHGQRQVLYQDKAGILVHLDLIATVVQHLDGRMLAAGKYREIQLEISNDAHLYGQNSIVVRVPISDRNGTITIQAEGEIEVSPARVVKSQIAIETDEFTRPLKPLMMRTLLATTPVGGCSIEGIC